MNEVKKALPTTWEKADDLAMTAVRMSDAGLPVQNRRYMTCNLHNYVAELFGMAKIGVLDLGHNRRKLELAIERFSLKYKWANKAKALKLFNDAWEHVKAAENPRMFLRQHQNEDEPKRIIDQYVAEWS